MYVVASYFYGVGLVSNWVLSRSSMIQRENAMEKSNTKKQSVWPVAGSMKGVCIRGSEGDGAVVFMHYLGSWVLTRVQD